MKSELFLNAEKVWTHELLAKDLPAFVVQGGTIGLTWWMRLPIIKHIIRAFIKVYAPYERERYADIVQYTWKCANQTCYNALPDDPPSDINTTVWLWSHDNECNIDRRI